MASVDNSKLESDHGHQQHDQQIEKVIKEDEVSKETAKGQEIPASSKDVVEEIAKHNPEGEKSVAVDVPGSEEEAAEVKQNQPPEGVEVEKFEQASVATDVPVESTMKEVETRALVAPDSSSEASKQAEEKPETEAVKVFQEEKPEEEPKLEAEPEVSAKEHEVKTEPEAVKTDLDEKPAVERVIEAETKDNSASEVVLDETDKKSSIEASTEKPDEKKLVDGVMPVAESIKEAGPEATKSETNVLEEEVIEDKPVAAAIEHEKKEDKPVAVAIEQEKKEISTLEVPESELTKQKESESVQEVEANLEKKPEVGTIESDLPKETIGETLEDLKPEVPKTENVESQDIKGALREIEAKAMEAVKEPVKEHEEHKETATVPSGNIEAQTTPSEPASDTTATHIEDSVSGKTEEVIKEKDTKIEEEKPEDSKPEERSETKTVPPGNVEGQTAPTEPVSDTLAAHIEFETKTEEEKPVDSKPEELKSESLTEEKPNVATEVESPEVKEAKTGTEAKAIEAEKPDESSKIVTVPPGTSESETNPSRPATEKPVSTKLEELIKENDANDAKQEVIETKEGNVAMEQESSELGKESSKPEEKETVKEAAEDKKTEPEETTRDLPVREVITKTTQKSSGNILSKVKHSIVKVKKAITGKSPSSKPATNEVKADENPSKDLN